MSNLFEEWRDENKLWHKEDGPAIIWASGDKSWYFHGKRHRTDGPAIEWKEQTSWYLHGEKLPCKSQEEFQHLMKLKAFW